MSMYFQNYKMFQLRNTFKINDKGKEGSDHSESICKLNTYIFFIRQNYLLRKVLSLYSYRPQHSSHKKICTISQTLLGQRLIHIYNDLNISTVKYYIKIRSYMTNKLDFTHQKKIILIHSFLNFPPPCDLVYPQYLFFF